MKKILIALVCCVALVGCKSDVEVLREEIEMLKLEKEKKAFSEVTELEKVKEELEKVKKENEELLKLVRESQEIAEKAIDELNKCKFGKDYKAQQAAEKILNMSKSAE